MSIKTYPEMNEKIVGFLRLASDNPLELYAAQLIEELQTAVNFHRFNSEFWEEKYNSLMEEKWIPVTERLPEERKTYLVKVESPHDPIRIYHFDPKNGNYSDNLWRNGDLSYVEDCFVTHWMPLPKPPKGVGS